MIEAETWPMVLLALRVGAVVLIYLFLFTAFRALRADLRSMDRPAVSVDRRQAQLREAQLREARFREAELRTAPSPALPALAPDIEETGDLGDIGDIEGTRDIEDRREPVPETTEAPATRRPTPPPPSRRLPVWSLIPATAMVMLAALAGWAFIQSETPDERAPATVNEQPTTDDPGEPPAVVPAPGRVTVGLAAREDSSVRVTVDGIVQFEGVMRAGDRASWEGSARIQVWTDKGKTLQLAVNGDDLGAYSPAMERPDWNRIDYGFWPGWPN